jgi:hypothetical protein
VATKLFFEGGFENTRVLVIGLKDTLLSKILTTDYRIGYAQILNVNESYKTIIVRVGKLTRKIHLQLNKFYRINVRDNELLVEEVSEELIYI